MEWKTTLYLSMNNYHCSSMTDGSIGNYKYVDSERHFGYYSAHSKSTDCGTIGQEESAFQIVEVHIRTSTISYCICREKNTVIMSLPLQYNLCSDYVIINPCPLFTQVQSVGLCPSKRFWIAQSFHTESNGSPSSIACSTDSLTCPPRCPCRTDFDFLF